MKWFKHMTDSVDDEKLAKLIGRHGMEGYGLWWLMLEVVAKQMPKDGIKCDVTYPLSYWMRLTGIYHHSHFKKILQSMVNLELISVQCPPNVELISGLSQRDVFTIFIPNLLKFRDEYSRKSGQNQESVRPKKEKEIQKENKDKTLNKTLMPAREVSVVSTTETLIRNCIAVKQALISEKYPLVDIEIETEEIVAKYKAVSIGADPWLIVSRWLKGLKDTSTGTAPRLQTFADAKERRAQEQRRAFMEG